MGMFDSVYADCPSCDGQIEFQSKAGDCCLSSYDFNSVPVEIAKDIDGEVRSCGSCGEMLKISLVFPVSNVPMKVE